MFARSGRRHRCRRRGCFAFDIFDLSHVYSSAHYRNDAILLQSASRYQTGSGHSAEPDADQQPAQTNRRFEVEGNEFFTFFEVVLETFQKIDVIFFFFFTLAVGVWKENHGTRPIAARIW